VCRHARARRGSGGVGSLTRRPVALAAVAQARVPQCGEGELLLLLEPRCRGADARPLQRGSSYDAEADEPEDGEDKA
jgi:hypothetical protein